MFTLTFWKAAAERAVSTFLQVFIASIGVGAAINEVDWLTIASVAGVAALLSVAKSVVANAATGTGPSFVASEQTVAPDEAVISVERF
jgi:Putative lactococcus lactis phage r1t holin